MIVQIILFIFKLPFITDSISPVLFPTVPSFDHSVDLNHNFWLHLKPFLRCDPIFLFIDDLIQIL